MFSLDDVSASSDTGVALGVWVSGSRLAGNSWTSSSYTAVLDNGYNRFTVPLYGGYDGLNITEKDPFNYTRALADGTDSTKYAYYSAKRAIDTVADPEVVEYNLMAMPGIYHAGLTSHMMEVCEARGDALAVIDLNSGYRTSAESTDSISERVGSVSTAISNLNTRGVNSSYGCAYYPWVQINDSITNSLLWAPPSIVALGTFSSSQRKSELWFAPAGFTRGGLTEGSAGIGVIQTRERLTSKQRDDLYEANVNPIASFPSEGIVIFGQKTLQVTPSALDRINVRRLMIYVKKEISRMAATVLFDQNVPATWNRFLSKAEPFLRSVQARLGLSDFKIILDESTTTADLVDRNVMYAKIFLKPARSIEFIALDFVITSTGAGFED
jgi:phage tail sheath protein FI